MVCGDSYTLIYLTKNPAEGGIYRYGAYLSKGAQIAEDSVQKLDGGWYRVSKLISEEAAKRVMSGAKSLGGDLVEKTHKEIFDISMLVARKYT